MDHHPLRPPGHTFPAAGDPRVPVRGCCHLSDGDKGRLRAVPAPLRGHSSVLTALCWLSVLCSSSPCSLRSSPPHLTPSARSAARGPRCRPRARPWGPLPAPGIPEAAPCGYHKEHSVTAAPGNAPHVHILCLFLTPPGLVTHPHGAALLLLLPQPPVSGPGSASGPAPGSGSGSGPCQLPPEVR